MANDDKKPTEPVDTTAEPEVTDVVEAKPIRGYYNQETGEFR
ncbi:hypothetical protein [Leifsonia sp. NPDC058248]